MEASVLWHPLLWKQACTVSQSTRGCLSFATFTSPFKVITLHDQYPARKIQLSNRSLHASGIYSYTNTYINFTFRRIIRCKTVNRQDSLFGTVFKRFTQTFFAKVVNQIRHCSSNLARIRDGTEGGDLPIFSPIQSLFNTLLQTHILYTQTYLNALPLLSFASHSFIH